MTKRNRKKSPSPPVAAKSRHIGTILAKIALLALLVCIVVRFTDRKGWFDPDDTNNHTQRKWDAFYKFTRSNPVDIVMVGNSHMYAGINPHNLSNALGANCFILAAPGTTLTDAYYCLKEAISVCKPKIAIVETYVINDYCSHELAGGGLSDQFQSFHARRNIWQKLASTPQLFTSGNYPAAWSNTIRNHSFIFTDRAQIRKNMQDKRVKKDNTLYLGRFVSFPKGMEDTTLRKYDVHGAVVDGNNFSIGGEACKYIGKTVDLCRKNNIELVFLTLPMYRRHVKDYDVWKSRLGGCLASYDPAWIDMQEPYDDTSFTPACFENSTRSNQHMSYEGSLVATYKLAHFLGGKFPGLLPDRSGDDRWKKLFYAGEGYFENHSPLPNDPANTILSGEVRLSGLTIWEIDLIDRKDDRLLLVKVDRQGIPDMHGKKLQLVIDAKLDGQGIVASAEAVTVPMYDPPGHYLFLSNIRKDVDITGIRNVTVMENTQGVYQPFIDD